MTPLVCTWYRPFTYLAAFAGVHTVVEAGSFVTAHTAQYGGSVEFWNERSGEWGKVRIFVVI